MNDRHNAAVRSVMFLVSHSSAGGAQEIWANLAEGFQDRGFRVILAALYPTDASRLATKETLPWRHIVAHRPKGPVGLAKMIRELTATINREKPAIVFTAMPAANIAASISAFLARTDTRVVTSHHSPAETHNPQLNALDGLAGSLPSVQTVVSVSKTVSASLEKKSARYRGRRKTIYNSLPPRIEAAIAQLAAQHEPRRQRNRLVVATGRLAMQKNYPLLIRASALMPDVSVIICGDGPDREKLVALAKSEGCEDRIDFRGHMPREKALATLADGDVFVQVSLFEGHSLALVEAAKLGLPIVVSDVPVQIEGITAEDGTRCGISVGVDDPETLAAAILQLLDDPREYERYCKLSAKLGAEARYEKMLDAYEALVDVRT